MEWEGFMSLENKGIVGSLIAGLGGLITGIVGLIFSIINSNKQKKNDKKMLLLQNDLEQKGKTHDIEFSKFVHLSELIETCKSQYKSIYAELFFMKDESNQIELSSIKDLSDKAFAVNIDFINFTKNNQIWLNKEVVSKSKKVSIKLTKQISNIALYVNNNNKKERFDELANMNKLILKEIDELIQEITNYFYKKSN